MKTIAAIAAITIIQVVAILKGIDAMLLGTTIAFLAGLGGFTAKELYDRLRR